LTFIFFKMVKTTNQIFINQIFMNTIINHRMSPYINHILYNHILTISTRIIFCWHVSPSPTWRKFVFGVSFSSFLGIFHHHKDFTNGYSRNTWFTQKIHGDFPVRYVNLYQRVMDMVLSLKMMYVCMYTITRLVRFLLITQSISGKLIRQAPAWAIGNQHLDPPSGNMIKRHGNMVVIVVAPQKKNADQQMNIGIQWYVWSEAKWYMFCKCLTSLSNHPFRHLLNCQVNLDVMWSFFWSGMWQVVVFQRRFSGQGWNDHWNHGLCIDF
jgi:hypothetical protein